MRSTSYHNIFIVDDDEDDRCMMDHSFRQIQWEDHIKLLDSGENMFRHLDTLTEPCSYPSLILLDYCMPRMGAEEILLRLKQHEQYRQIKVMIYSTVMNDGLCCRLKALGASACYSKALDFSGSVRFASTLRNKVQQSVVA